MPAAQGQEKKINGGMFVCIILYFHLACQALVGLANSSVCKCIVKSVV